MFHQKKQHHHTWKNVTTCVKVLYHYGEEILKGMKYIVTKGECYFLKPNLVKMKLTHSEFNVYIQRLLQAKENKVVEYINNNEINRLLINKNINENKDNFRGKIPHVVLFRKNSNSYLNLLNNVENYIKYILPISKISCDKDEYFVYVYEIKRKFITGNSFTFGNNVSSLYTIVSSPGSVFSLTSFNNLISLPSEQEITFHHKNISFLISHPIFQGFPENYFKKHCYPYFKYNKNISNEHILIQGNLSSSIVFIKKGIFELKTKTNLIELNEAILYLQTMNQFNSKFSVNLYEEFLLNKHDFLSEQNSTFHKKINKNTQRIEFTVMTVSTGEMIGCYIYSLNQKNIFTLSNTSSDVNTNNHYDLNNTFNEFFTMKYSVFQKIFNENSQEQKELNKYLNIKRKILLEKLNQIKYTLFKPENGIQVKKMQLNKKANKSCSPTSNSHIKTLHKTFIESKIFPLKQYHQKRKYEKPRHKFVNNFAKFLIKTINTDTNCKIVPIKKRSSANLNISKLKSTFLKLNPNVQHTSTNQIISSIKMFQLFDKKEENEEKQRVNMLKINKTQDFTEDKTTNFDKKKNNVKLNKQFIRMELLTRDNFNCNKKSLLYSPEAASKLITFNRNYKLRSEYRNQLTQDDLNKQNKSLPILATTTQSKGSSSRTLNDAYFYKNSYNKSRNFLDVNITLNNDNRNSYY